MAGLRLEEQQRTRKQVACMRIPKSVAREMDEFLRYLALTPSERDRFRSDPEAYMRAVRLSEEATGCILDNGLDTVLTAIQNKRDDIMDHPDSWKRTEFGRDRSVPGYGGKVIKKQT